MIYVIRNNQQFGPYDESTLVSYVNNGQILLCDKAQDAYYFELHKSFQYSFLVWGWTIFIII